MAMLEFDNVSMVYEGSDHSVRALDALSLSVAAGEPVAVIGPSGCGKSTLLLIAAGLLKPTEGAVRVGGSAVEGPRRETALILQDFGLLPWKTVEANAALGLTVRGVARAEVRTRVAEALERVGIAEFARAYPAELSGGMRQRLALARAVALDADVLLMDEPLSALDALKREDLQNVLLELWQRRGHAHVLVTHSIEEAAFLGRRVVVMSPRPGRVSAIVESEGMGSAGYRASGEFFQVVTQLRSVLAEEGAFAVDGAGVSGGTSSGALTAAAADAGARPRGRGAL
jgi:ABC-type nitrate/sulfonate/bicarbonate transport system ATPase subunit